MKESYKILLIIMTLFGGINSLFTQVPVKTMTSQKLANNIYLVRGGVANTGFVIGDKGVLVIDANMNSEGTKSTLDEIRKQTSMPVTELILTHSDGDHVNGIGGFPQGIVIISQEQAKKEMEEAFKVPELQALKAYLPGKTFTDKMDLVLGSENIQLLYFGPAHTSGDAVVLFPAEKVAFVGDLIFKGQDPIIHTEKGGSSTGLLMTLKELLGLDVDRYIPGHNEVLSKSDINAEIKNIEEKQFKIKQLIQEGKSLTEVKTALGVVDQPGVNFRFPSLVEIIYNEFSSIK
jgi:cyclase